MTNAVVFCVVLFGAVLFGWLLTFPRALRVGFRLGVAHQQQVMDGEALQRDSDVNSAADMSIDGEPREVTL